MFPSEETIKKRLETKKLGYPPVFDYSRLEKKTKTRKESKRDWTPIFILFMFAAACMIGFFVIENITARSVEQTLSSDKRFNGVDFPKDISAAHVPSVMKSVKFETRTMDGAAVFVSMTAPSDTNTQFTFDKHAIIKYMNQTRAVDVYRNSAVIATKLNEISVNPVISITIGRIYLERKERLEKIEFEVKLAEAEAEKKIMILNADRKVSEFQLQLERDRKLFEAETQRMVKEVSEKNENI